MLQKLRALWKEKNETMEQIIYQPARFEYIEQ